MKRFGWFVELFIVLYILFGLFCYAHAKEQKPRSNAFGAVIRDDNPFVYMLGLPIDGKVVEYDKHIGLNISFWPFGTSSLHQEQVLFCGDVSESFNGKRGVLVVVYRRQSSVNFGGVGCHQLEGVFEVKEP